MIEKMFTPPSDGHQSAGLRNDVENTIAHDSGDGSVDWLRAEDGPAYDRSQRNHGVAWYIL
jgi:hypothetical protein